MGLGRQFLAAMLLVLVLVHGLGGCVHYRGYAAADGRAYFQKPKYAGQAHGSGVSLVMEPEFYVQSKNEKHTVTLQPFARVDPFDRARTHYDVRQADYVARQGGWEFGAGASTFTWGALENHRVVDAINQSDLVEDLDGSQKLGQPYTKVAWNRGRWSLGWYYLPYFRTRTFAGPQGRLRFPTVIDTRQALYQSNLGPWHPNFAARLGVTVGDFDFGLSGFSGTSREPRFIAQITSPEVVPQYDYLEQVSFDAQWTRGGFIAKAEALARWWNIDLRFSGAVGGGLEYWFFDIAGSGVDLTLAAEYYYDARSRDAPLTFYQNDVFGGFRIAINDVGDTQILGGAMADVTSGATFLRFGIERRFDEHWKLGLEGRGFLSPAGILEHSLVRDNFVQLRVAYFF